MDPSSSGLGEAWGYTVNCPHKKKVLNSAFLKQNHINVGSEKKVIGFCRVTNCNSNPKGIGYGPNKPNTIKFVREWVKELGW